MDDGHTGLKSSQVNQGQSGNFKLVLSALKHSSGKSEFVLHVASNAWYSFGLQPDQFLSRIGLTPYHGQCPFLHDGCFYHVIAVAQQSFPGMEHFTQVQHIHDSFRRFAEKLNDLFQLCQQEENILREIDLKSSWQPLVGQPVQIEIQERYIPVWVSDVKFPQLRALEEQKALLQKQLDELNQFLPLLYGTGDILEKAVLHTLRFLGLDAEQTEKGFTADIRAQTPDGSMKFGLEVTGIVNARILLRQDNFDRPFLLFLPTVDHLQGSLLFVLLLAKIDATTPPYGWSPPPGPSVVDGWRRDERTRDRPQSKLECARLVCQAYHRHPGSTTSRPPRPRLAHSRCPQGRAAPPQATPVRLVPFESLACARVRYPPLADFACAKQELTLLSFLTPRLSERPTIFHAVTGTVNRNDLRMMQEPVEQGGGENLVSQ